MPEMKRKKLNLTEKNILGEAEIVYLPRDKKGRFVSKKKIADDYRQRPIKLVKVKGSYGSFEVKEKLIPNEVKATLFGVVIIGILIAVI